MACSTEDRSSRTQLSYRVLYPCNDNASAVSKGSAHLDYDVLPNGVYFFIRYYLRQVIKLNAARPDQVES